MEELQESQAKLSKYCEKLDFVPAKNVKDLTGMKKIYYNEGSDSESTRLVRTAVFDL